MKIMYFMNVDWGWIKQRPHFIAEGLSNSNDVLLYYPHTYKKKNGTLCDNSSERIRPHKYYNLPFRRRSKLIERINSLYLKLLFQVKILAYKPDLIWIAGNPDAAGFLNKKSIAKSIYDCMDDYYAMSQSVAMLNNEKCIVNNCRHIIVSSESLKNVLIKRYSIKENRLTLVRNGYDGNIIEDIDVKRNNDEYDLAYIGTVSSWFDFDLIKQMVNTVKGVKIHVVGPIKPEAEDACKSLENDRVIFYGSKEHKELYEFAKNMDCLMMPFIINDIILSVDPVKLYEYINFRKNILCVYYPEIERFREFVNFYTTRDEAINQLRKLMDNPSITYSDNERIEFLKENDWENRLKSINIVLDGSEN